MLASQIAALTAGRTSVTLKRERAWASVTFAGTRYSFAIMGAAGTDPAMMENLIQVLPNHEFAIPGYFVADVLVTEQSGLRLLVEALLINDPV